MGTYCITAANHKNKSNHCASQFKVWEFDASKNTWSLLGGKSINFVNDLMANGHTVLSAKENDKDISTGAAIESELRIIRNEKKYNVSEMPTFK